MLRAVVVSEIWYDGQLNEVADKKECSLHHRYIKPTLSEAKVRSHVTVYPVIGTTAPRPQYPTFQIQ